MSDNPRTPESRAIGLRIRDERKRAGLSRQDFAKLLGTSPKTITNYETGFRPSDVRLAQIAKALNRSFDYLRTGAGERSTAYEVSSTKLDATPLLRLIAPEFERLLRCLVDEAVRRALEKLPAPTPPPAPAPQSSRGRAGGAGSRRRGPGGTP